MNTLLAVRGLEKTTPRFRAALLSGAVARGLDPHHLATVISLESQFDPKAKNRHSGALGLIQWVSDASFNATAKRAGMPWLKRSQLPTLSAEAQLPLVFAWYDGIGRLKPTSPLVDYYLAVWGPAHIGKPGYTVVAAEPELAYEQNKGFDDAGRGYFTIDDIAREVGQIRTAALGRPPLPANYSELVDGRGLAAAVAVAVGAYMLLPRVSFGRRILAFG